MNERTFDDFDEFATNYRSIHTENLKLSGADSLYFAQHKILQLKQTEEDNGLTLLDVGCGDGAAEIFLNEFFPSWKLEGIDITKQSIAEAQNRKIPAANFQLYNGTEIPFEDNKFDIVFMAAVLHHIDFSLHNIVISEIHRALKPGGRIYIFEHNPLNPFTRYLVKTCPFDKNAKLLSSNYCKQILKEKLFKQIKVKYILFFPRKGLLSKLIWMEEKLGWLPIGGQYFYRAIK
ncbi:MAG: class I SAM-dependent methyltransferase [Ferruginibacter sp.]